MSRNSHWRYSLKKGVTKISQYSQKTPVLKSLFNKFEDPQPCNFVKEHLLGRTS